MDGRTYPSFRIMARAIQRDLYGNVMLLDSIAPAVSAKIIVRQGSRVLGFSGLHAIACSCCLFYCINEPH